MLRIPTKYILNGLNFCSCRIRTPILAFADADLGDNIEVIMYVKVNIGNIHLRDGHLARTVLRARVFSVATANIGVTRGDMESLGFVMLSSLNVKAESAIDATLLRIL